MQPPWTQLEADLAVLMSGCARQGLRFFGPRQAIPGMSETPFKSDGCITDGTRLLALEVEAGQTHPDTNVGKYWLLRESDLYEQVTLIHVYTPDCNQPSRRALGEFYADMMRQQMPFIYLPLDAASFGGYQDACGACAWVIHRCIKSMFPVD